MYHDETMQGVTLRRAGELLGGDVPLSKRAISAMIARGELQAYGKYKGRRVTMQSIVAYQNAGADRQPHAIEAVDYVPPARPRRRGGRETSGSLDLAPARLPKQGLLGSADSIPARLPRRGRIRS